MIGNGQFWYRTFWMLTGRSARKGPAENPRYIHAKREDPMRLLSQIAAGEVAPPIANPHRRR